MTEAPRKWRKRAGASFADRLYSMCSVGPGSFAATSPATWNGRAVGIRTYNLSHVPGASPRLTSSTLSLSARVEATTSPGRWKASTASNAASKNPSSPSKHGCQLNSLQNHPAAARRYASNPQHTSYGCMSKETFCPPK